MKKYLMLYEDGSIWLLSKPVESSGVNGWIELVPNEHNRKVLRMALQYVVGSMRKQHKVKK